MIEPGLKYAGSHKFVTLDDSLLPSHVKNFNNGPKKIYQKSKPRDLLRNITTKTLFEQTCTSTCCMAVHMHMTCMSKIDDTIIAVKEVDVVKR